MINDSRPKRPSKRQREADAARRYQLADENYRSYRESAEAHKEWVAEADRYDAMYRGDQWEDADLKALEESKRPALTLNMILSTVNTLLGEQTQNRADVQFKPKRGTDEATARDLGLLYKHVIDANDFYRHEQKVFADGLITDRGYFDIRVSYYNNIAGEIEIRPADAYDVIPDKNARDPDPATWNECHITYWLTLDEIEQQFGKAARAEIEGLVGTSNYYVTDSLEFVDPKRFGTNNPNIDSLTNAEGLQLARVRVIDRQYYKLTQANVLINPTTGQIRDVPMFWSDEETAAYAQRYGMMVDKRPRRRVRWCVSVDHVLLFEGWSQYRTLTVVPYFPYFRPGRPFGMVRNLISPQELLNKTASQELHIVNTTANSGWMMEENSLVDMTADELAEQGAKTGLVVEYKKGFTPPEKIQPNSVPTGIDRISDKALMAVRQVSGINESLLGMDKPSVSGVALEQRTNRGMVQVQLPLSNLKWTRQMVARKVVELIQDFYTEGRIIYVTDTDEPEQPSQEHVINAVDENGEVINDISRGEFEVVITDVPARDTLDDIQFAEALSLRREGVPIPGYVIVEHSHLARKREVARLLKNLEGFGEPTPEQQQKMQMQEQIALETAMAEIAGLKAKAENLMAQAQLNANKAAELEGANKVEEQIRNLQTQLALAQENLDKRFEMSRAGHINAQVQNQRNNAVKLTTAAMQLKQRAQDAKKTPTSKKGTAK